MIFFQSNVFRGSLMCIYVLAGIEKEIIHNGKSYEYKRLQVNQYQRLKLNNC